MTLRALVPLALCAGLVLAGDGARAGETVDVRVTATVLAICKISSVRDIQFGTLDPSQATTATAQGEIAFTCTRGVDYRLVADKGQHFDAGTQRRRMRGAGDRYLPYALAADTFSGTGRGFREPISIGLSATIEGADYRDLPADAYGDTLRIVLEP